MTFMADVVFEFNLLELLCLLGLSQCVYVLVYIALRSDGIKQIILPTLFFGVLADCFLFGAAESRWSQIVPHYEEIQWGLWLLLAPVSMLLIVKIIRITEEPQAIFWFMPLLVPLAFISVDFLSQNFGKTADWFHIHAIIIGGLSLLMIWANRDGLDSLHKRKYGKERYWLIICLILMNIILLSLGLLQLNGILDIGRVQLVQVLVGLGFIYIASTSLFRIFPHSLALKEKSSETETLSPSDIKFALKIEDLLNLEKVYQEASYGRPDLAKELGLSESNLSRIVKLYFDKGVPQLLNECRIREAKDLLLQTDIDITTLAGEAGFNSIATFNRVFKDLEGVSPTEFRKVKA